MTRDELIRRRQERLKWTNKIGLICFVFTFAIIGVFIIIGYLLPQPIKDSQLVIFSGISIMLLTLVSLLVWVMASLGSDKRLRASGLLCPYCEGRLDGHYGDIAMATTCCAHCGQVVIEDVDISPIDSPNEV